MPSLDVYDVLFGRHLFIKSVSNYAPAILLLYAIIIAIGAETSSNYVVLWIELCSPFVDAIRQQLPFGERLDHLLATRGYRNLDVNAFYHFAAAGVAYFIIMFVFETTAVITRRRSDWTRLNSAVPTIQLLYRVLAALGVLLFCLALAVFDFAFTLWGDDRGLPFDVVVMLPIVAAQWFSMDLQIMMMARLMGQERSRD